MSTRMRARSSHRTFLALSFVAAAALTTPSFAAPLAIGAVEKFDSKASTIVVLGQTYEVGSATLVAGKKSYPASNAIRLLAPGALLWVDGELRRDGKAKVDSLTVLPETNTPGATQLFVAGVVKSIDRSGRARIGALSVDITPTLGSLGSAVHPGDVVEVLGIQPIAGGVLVATAIAPARDSTHGVGGTGLNGVGGTGLNGVGGTGLNGVGGTGLNGVGGTGLNGVGGTGLNGVGGTGLNGVGGTGLNGVGGTGLNGAGGTGLNGVGGTGLNGVGGTGLNGVGGTGLNGVGGTGLNGVGGTGLNGVGGTGLNGVGGTGLN